MIIDHLAQAALYTRLGTGFVDAFQFLGRPDLADLADGRVEIDGDRVYAMISRANGRPREGAKLEAHRRYIDVHTVLAGRENMGWKPTPTCRKPEADFDVDRDFQLFLDEPDAWVTLHPGQFAAVYPADAHLPLVGEGPIHKVVLKIAV